MVFLLEGGAVDKRLGYATALAVEQTAKERWAKNAGLHGKEAAVAVWKAMPQLHECRLHCVNVQPKTALDSTMNTFGDNSL